MSNETSTLIPAGTPAPEHFALGYLTSSIRILKGIADDSQMKSDCKYSTLTLEKRMEEIESEIARLASTMEQLNRELYPEIV